MMSELAYNIWGAVASVIGTVAVLRAVFCWALDCLPSRKMDFVEKFLDKTKASFGEVLNSGILDQDEVYRFDSWLAHIESRVDDVRADVYNIHTWQQDLTQWRQGLSGDMAMICQALMNFRARLAKTSSRERRALASAGYTAHSSLPSHVSGSTEQLWYPKSGPATRSPVLHFPVACPSRASGMCTTAVRVPTASTSDSMSSSPSSSDNESLCDSPSDLPNAKHHVLSDDDLRQLLSLALNRQSRDPESGVRQLDAAQEDVLKRFGGQLCGLDAGGHLGAETERHPELS
ncbi:hypothetical protein GY45DRAFT_179615 [Cubamyces sp. BRFM 1775]|nr:hypothetical protein GY45DRAFT_179615 [Cubamyces sp. BRFM 1775]